MGRMAGKAGMGGGARVLAEIRTRASSWRLRRMERDPPVCIGRKGEWPERPGWAEGPGARRDPYQCINLVTCAGWSLIRRHVSDGRAEGWTEAQREALVRPRPRVREDR